MPGRQPRYLKLGPLYDDPPTMDRNDPPAQKPKPKPKNGDGSSKDACCGLGGLECQALFGNCC